MGSGSSSRRNIESSESSSQKTAGSVKRGTYVRDPSQARFASASVLLGDAAFETHHGMFKEVDGFVVLPRGGFVVETNLGPIQFGIPPETIKDSIDGGFPVPRYFVIYGELFDRELGLSRAEFEFPVYFNFFVKKRKVCLITTRAARATLLTAFQETFFGPDWLRSHPGKIAQDYPEGTPSDSLPMIFDEGIALDTARSTLTIGSLISFVEFETNARIIAVEEQIDNEFKTIKPVGICLTREGPNDTPCFRIGFTDPNTKKAKIIKVPLGTMYHSASLIDILRNLTERCASRAQAISATTSVGSPLTTGLSARHLHIYNNIKDMVGFAPFNIPEFGVTFLGVSHGFDNAGTTTGFVIWVHRRGIVVDPPPLAFVFLERMGIPPSSVDGVILTHCHADHDAGTFQKILLEKKINLYTTKTIRDSFIVKYSAITGFDGEFLNSLFTFKPVIIGESMNIHGGSFRFFYSLHTIPCIGFEVFYRKESFYYSGDTLFDPMKVNEMLEGEIIGKGRAEQLSRFPTQHTIIVHEMGVPPIHTRPETLNEQCELAGEITRDGDVLLLPLRERLFAIHCRGSDAQEQGLHPLKQYETFRVILQNDVSDTEDLSSVLGHIRCVPWLQNIELACFDQIDGLKDHCRKRALRAGDTLVHAGDPVSLMFFILGGKAVMEIPPASSAEEGSLILLNLLSCINEDSLLCELKEAGSVRNKLQSYSVRCQTELHVLEVDVVTFSLWLSYCGAAEHVRASLSRVHYIENEGSSEAKLLALAHCKQLNYLLNAQRCQDDFLCAMKPTTYPKGATLNSLKQHSHYCYLLTKGSVLIAITDLTFRGNHVTDLQPHVITVSKDFNDPIFIGDVNNLWKSEESCMRLVALSDIECYIITRADFCDLCGNYPGILVKMLDQFTLPRVNPECFPGHVRVKEDKDPNSDLDFYTNAVRH